jgi:sulfide dehydrogenase [flavocytochrome c] flavoprotein chain
MTCWSRRQLGYLAGVMCIAALRPQAVRGQAKARVVVIGGGVGGATAAKYLAKSSEKLDVTLVEPKAQYATCFLSNLYLAGLRSLQSLMHGYEALAQKYGVNVVHDSVTAIDPVAKHVSLEGGAKLSYDRVVLAPGIAFKAGVIEGYDDAAMQIMPHAWTAGPQTRLLRQQLESMEDGGVFVLVAPPDPFRCPPGPYERASLIAYYFKQYKPRAKILILDAKDSFFGQDVFEDGWHRHYPGMIEWLPAQFTGGIKTVDVKRRLIKTAADTFKADVANIIPAQEAGRLAHQAHLVDQSGWCPIDPMTFESKLQPGIHVIGDAAKAGNMAKSAFASNSQAKVCAFAILATLTGSARFVPHFFNSCFTLLASDDALMSAISYSAEPETIKVKEFFVSKVGDKAETRRQAVREADGWYAAFTHDIFG